MNKGLIFNIQKFSIHDGPGIRTTVFLKGCPLRCAWCSNPESQLNNIQILYDIKKCIHCNKCIEICPKDCILNVDNRIIIDHKKCDGCLKCINVCENKALKNKGEYRGVDEIVNTCLQDVYFYEESDGGVTISGGEGMSQPEFLASLVKKLKKHNIHVSIETSGYVEASAFKKLSVMFDLLLFDLKHYDSDKHLQQTKVNNELIISNLKWAIENKLNILVRIPVIPEFNNSLNDALNMCKLLKELGINKVQLLPFHQLGEYKYEMLNIEYDFKSEKALYLEDLVEYQSIFMNNDIDCFF